MKTISPIKRSDALVPLSRDHHFGLLLSWKIRQGLAKNVQPERISKYVIYFFEADLQAHFMEEEALLFSKAPAGDILCERALQEHSDIIDWIGDIRQNPGNKLALSGFADALENHIRFEERILFNHLQEQLNDEDLEILKDHTREKKADPDDRWKDLFWNQKS
ncbi:MAG TPA: hemerythrin domain-containing protein [Chitinophagaceae bacterium]|nr:hemerythrin domain-containing protein [Chitinophagaceae bacterium]